MDKPKTQSEPRDMVQVFADELMVLDTKIVDCIDVLNRQEMDKAIQQLRTMRKHVDSLINMLGAPDGTTDNSD